MKINYNSLSLPTGGLLLLAMFVICVEYALTGGFGWATYLSAGALALAGGLVLLATGYNVYLDRRAVRDLKEQDAVKRANLRARSLWDRAFISEAQYRKAVELRSAADKQHFLDSVTQYR